MPLDHREAEQYSYRNRPSKDGKPLSYFTERSEVLVRIGPSGLLYLRFLQITFFFLFALSVIEVGHTYIFYMNNPSTVNVIYRLSIANWTPALNGNYIETIILASLEAAALICFVLYVKLFGLYRDYLNKGADKIIRSVAEYSVHVKRVPKDEPEYGTMRLRKFFNHFGRVIDVKFGLDSGNVTKWKKKLLKLEHSIKHSQAIIDSGKASIFYRPYLRYKIYKERRQYASLDAKIKQKLEQENFKCTGDAFVTFNSERARYMCLHYFNRPLIQTLCSNMRFLANSNKLVSFRVSEAKPHTDIIWENLEYGFFSRYLRRSVALLIALITLVVCVVSSFYLTQYQNSTLKALYQGYKQSGINYAISLVMVISGQIASYIMYGLGDFEKHRSKSSKQTSQLTKLALMLCAVGVCVMGPFMTEASNLSQTVPLINRPLEAFYESDDFYYQLLTSFVLGVVANVVIQVVQMPAYWLYKVVCARLAVTQEELNRAHMPPLFDFTFRYSSQLRLVMLALCFSGLFPCALYITCVGLFLSYFVDKFNLIKVFAKNNKVEDHMTENAVWCLCLAWLVRYILMAVRVYYLTCLTPPLNLTNPYLLSFIACSGTYVVFLFVTYVLQSGTSTLVHWLCCSKYRFPEYVTDKKGVSPPDPSLRLYNPPLTIEEIMRRKVKKVCASTPADLQKPLVSPVTVSESSPTTVEFKTPTNTEPEHISNHTVQHDWEEDEEEFLQGPTIADLDGFVPHVEQKDGATVPLIESPIEVYAISAQSPYTGDVEMVSYVPPPFEQMEVDDEIHEANNGGGRFMNALGMNIK